MPRNLHADVIAELSKQYVRPGFMLDLGFHGTTLYYTTKNFDVVYNSNTYFGNGLLLPLTGIRENTELVSSSVQIELINPGAVLISALLNSVNPSVLSTIYLAFFQENGAIIGTPYVIFKGYIDRPVIEDQTDERKVSIELTTNLQKLGTGSNLLYGKEDQAVRFPGVTDLGFEYLKHVSSWNGYWGKRARKIPNRKKRHKESKETL